MGKIKGFKGFNKNLQCRDFQNEIGKDLKKMEKLKLVIKAFTFAKTLLMYLVIIHHLIMGI
jgi:hypothetical protein